MAESTEKKFLTLPRLQEYDALLKQKTENDDAATLKSAKSYSDNNLNQAKTYVDNKIDSIESGVTIVAEATKATQDGKGNVIDATYETVSNAKTRENTLKSYTDSKVSSVVGNASENLNTLEKIGSSLNKTISDQNTKNTTFQNLINDNANAISSKADKTHKHAISDITNLQSSLDSKASASHSHTVDASLSSTSTNPVQNKVVNAALDSKVPTNRTINGKPLSANVTLNASDVGADASGSANTALTNAKSYTDTKINALVGEGASETLDTIGEIATAIEDNQEGIDLLNAAVGKKADKTTVDSHISNKSNPHGVTKAQVGLGNVDNTSDANKPISTATQTALNQKLSLSGGAMTGDIRFGSTGGIELKGKNWDIRLSDSDGLTVSLNPFEENQVTNKRYVDTEVSKKASVSIITWEEND